MYLIPGEVGESAVAIGHFMGVFTLFNRCTRIIKSISYFGSHSIGHGHALFRPRGGHKPH
jgi:hypothetical protein